MTECSVLLSPNSRRLVSASLAFVCTTHTMIVVYVKSLCLPFNTLVSEGLTADSVETHTCTYRVIVAEIGDGYSECMRK